MQKNGASWLKFKNEHIWEIVTMTSYINPFVVSVFCKEISSFLEVIISQLNSTTAVIWSVWLSNATKNLRHRVHSWFVPWIRIQGTNRLCVRRKQHCLGKQSYSIHCNTIIPHITWLGNIWWPSITTTQSLASHKSEQQSLSCLHDMR